MATARLEIQGTGEQLLRAVEQLDQEELERFVAEVLRIRARRGSAGAPASEVDLPLL